jgi:hypothetical protein
VKGSHGICGALVQQLQIIAQALAYKRFFEAVQLQRARLVGFVPVQLSCSPQAASQGLRLRF